MDIKACVDKLISLKRLACGLTNNYTTMLNTINTINTSAESKDEYSCELLFDYFIELINRKESPLHYICIFTDEIVMATNFPAICAALCGNSTIEHIEIYYPMRQYIKHFCNNVKTMGAIKHLSFDSCKLYESFDIEKGITKKNTEDLSNGWEFIHELMIEGNDNATINKLHINNDRLDINNGGYYIMQIINTSKLTFDEIYLSNIYFNNDTKQLFLQMFNDTNKNINKKYKLEKIDIKKREIKIVKNTNQ